MHLHCATIFDIDVVAYTVWTYASHYSVIFDSTLILFCPWCCTLLAMLSTPLFLT